MVNKTYVGEGKVHLLAGGGRLYSDIAARFCKSERSMIEICDSPLNESLVELLAGSPHKSVLEFDDFIFGIEGYSRTTEVQLVRKRHASYTIKSGIPNKKGKRAFDVVVPPSVEGFSVDVIIPSMYNTEGYDDIHLTVDSDLILSIISDWYDRGVELGIPEGDLRFIKPQATEFKALIKMNASALKDWFMIHMCNRASVEHQDLAGKMYRLCLDAVPALFKGMGASCKVLGYCPEIEQCDQCKGVIPTQAEMRELIAKYYRTPGRLSIPDSAYPMGE